MPKPARLPDHAQQVTTYADLDRFLKAFADGPLDLMLLLGSPGVGKGRAAALALGTAAGRIEGHVTGFGHSDARRLMGASARAIGLRHGR